MSKKRLINLILFGASIFITLIFIVLWMAGYNVPFVFVLFLPISSIFMLNNYGNNKK